MVENRSICHFQKAIIRIMSADKSDYDKAIADYNKVISLNPYHEEKP